MKTLLLACTGLAWIAPLAAHAAAANTGSNTLEELVVTAEKREQNLQDVPDSVTALSAAEIKTRRIQSVGDIVRQVPNVNFGEIGFGTQLSSRGIGTSLITGLGESSVAVYMDGLYLSRPSMAALMQKDLGRVEFLRGPQGTLYGRNATGGVLNLISPSPPSTLSGGVTLGAGNHEQSEVEAHIGGPIGQHIRARLFVGYDGHGGYTKNLFGSQSLDASRAFGTRLSIDGDLGDAADFQLRTVYQHETSSGPVFKPIQSGLPIPASTYTLDPFAAKPNALADRHLEMFSTSARLNYRLDDLAGLGAVRLSSITGYIRYTPDVLSIDADGTSLDLFTNQVFEHDHELTQEFNAVHTGPAMDWTLGAFYMREHIRADRLTPVPGFAALGISLIGFKTDSHATSSSVFADGTWKATGRLQVFGGLRGTWEKHQQDELSFQTLTSGAQRTICAPGTPLGSISRDDDAVTGRLGAKYHLSDTNFYVQASRGFKSGGIGYSTCGNSFEPEKLDAIEVGAKTETLQHRLRFDVSAFYYNLKNLQVEQIQTVGSAISSVPKSRIYGAELEGDWLITPRLRVNFAGGLLNAEYVRFFDIDSLNPAAGLQNLSGKALNRSPKWSASLGGQYEQPTWDGGTLLFRIDLRSTDKFTLRPEGLPLDYQPGYSLVDGSITYTSPSGRYEVRGWVKNATNKAYLQGMFGTVIVQRVGTYGAPRMAGVELSARF